MGEGEGEEVCQEGWWWWGGGPCVSWVNLLFPADVKNTVCNRLLVNHYPQQHVMSSLNNRFPLPLIADSWLRYEREAGSYAFTAVAVSPSVSLSE